MFMALYYFVSSTCLPQYGGWAVGHKRYNLLKRETLMKKQTLFIILLLSTACSSVPVLSNQDELATVVASTLTAQPIISTPISTLTAAPIPTAPARGPVSTFTSEQNVTLRTQP